MDYLAKIPKLNWHPNPDNTGEKCTSIFGHVFHVYRTWENKWFYDGTGLTEPCQNLEEGKLFCEERYKHQLISKGFEIVENAVEITPDTAEHLLYYQDEALFSATTMKLEQKLWAIFDKIREIAKEQND